ncbi:MAG: fimbrillin family protein [Rikenellaceae bacterium]|nr:fimbrillin family protein [Rikenellaceae bacterium]
MKKIFLFAAAAMVSLSSCVQTQEVYTGDVHEMGFKSAVTRGIVQTNDDMVYPLAVSAVWDSTDDSTANFGVYFDGAKFVYDEGTSLWKGEPARYWPTSGDMHFLAFSPFPSVATLTTTYKADGTIEKMDVIGINNNIKNQHDVLYSDLLSVEAPQTAAQSLQFHHALAQINVTFKKTDSAAAVVLNSVKLLNAYFTGDVCIVPAEGAKSTASWTQLGLKTNSFFLEADATGVEDGVLDQVLVSDSAYAPIPQVVMPSDQTAFEIIYTIDGHQHTYIHDCTLDAHEAPIVPTPKWEMGYKYTYNFTINVNEIIFDCEVENWIPAEGGTITI